MSNNLDLTLPSYGMTTTRTRKELKQILLDTGGWTFMNGYCCDIRSKHLGCGVYKVWLEQRR